MLQFTRGHLVVCDLAALHMYETTRSIHVYMTHPGYPKHQTNSLKYKCHVLLSHTVSLHLTVWLKYGMAKFLIYNKILIFKITASSETVKLRTLCDPILRQNITNKFNFKSTPLSQIAYTL